MSQTNRYGSLAAEMYDVDKPVDSLFDDAFHRPRLAEIVGPILEPACGSGRALIPLMEAGHEVVGFDASAEMLENCRVRCAARGLSPDLSQQSFEDFHYDRTFAAVFVPAGSFGLIADYATAAGVLRRFHDALSPGGLLIMDVQPISALAQSSASRRSWTADNGDLLICETKPMAVDWVAQIETHHTLYERWRNGALIESALEPMALRYWGLEEMRMTLEASGFEDVVVIGNHNRRRPPRSSDGRLTFEATRAG